MEVVVKTINKVPRTHDRFLQRVLKISHSRCALRDRPLQRPFDAVRVRVAPRLEADQLPDPNADWRVPPTPNRMMATTASFSAAWTADYPTEGSSLRLRHERAVVNMHEAVASADR
jgi:hypothetical protein